LRAWKVGGIDHDEGMRGGMKEGVMDESSLIILDFYHTTNSGSPILRKANTWSKGVTSILLTADLIWQSKME